MPQAKAHPGLAQKLVSQWRDSLNPLSHLNMPTLTHFLAEGRRGALTQIQNLYDLIERRDATLRACRRHLESAIGSMRHNVTAFSPRAPEKAAAEQQDAVENFLQQLQGFSEAISFLATAEFRGYAHLEKVRDHHDDIPTALVPIPQAYWVREGTRGGWKFNPEGRIGTTEGNGIETNNFIIREVSDPVDEIAAICFLRKSLSQKDWDAFLESYGIPWLFLVLPEYLHADEEGQEEILRQMNRIASDSRGVLAHGSKIETADPHHRGKEPFSQHIRYQDEQIVLAATSGKLTVLSESGTGTLAGKVHRKTWEEIAKYQANNIASIIENQLIAPFIRQCFGDNQPILVRFSLEWQREKDDLLNIANAVDKLSTHGYQISARELSSRTGYRIEKEGEAKK